MDFVKCLRRKNVGDDDELNKLGIWCSSFIGVYEGSFWGRDGDVRAEKDIGNNIYLNNCKIEKFGGIDMNTDKSVKIKNNTGFISNINTGNDVEQSSTMYKTCIIDSMSNKISNIEAIHSDDKKVNMGFIASSSHVESAKPILKIMLIITGIIAALTIIGGIFGIIWNSLSPTEMNILGIKVSTGHVGVAFTAFGVIAEILIFKAVLKNIYKLSSLNSNNSNISQTQNTGNSCTNFQINK